MRPELHTLLLILVCAGVTIALRALPFLALGRGGQPPALVRRLGERLPPAVMAILVVYCLRSTSFAALSGWVPALAAGAATVALHVWRRNTLLSIPGGTLLYMLLIRCL